MGLKFAIIYEGQSKQDKKVVKTMMVWPEEKVLKIIKKHFKVKPDFDRALKAAINEFKKKSVQIP